ncbi:MAG: hypothetical protein UIM53_09405 [Acutalibacteraceae bacterium]|nr:hypothetical protein [Acutalibacteraceae bacterium]
MEKLYIVFVDTPGLFATIIRRVIKMNYVHVVLSLDEELTKAYSVGRRHPAIPIFSGFEMERLDRIYRKYPNAKYRVTYIECTREQKENIESQLQQCYDNRFKYHYCILGLPFLLFNKSFYQKNHFTCSSFTSKILEENGIKLFNKHFSLVTPRDFYDLDLPVVYEGAISVLAERYIELMSEKFSTNIFTMQKNMD